MCHNFKTRGHTADRVKVRTTKGNDAYPLAHANCGMADVRITDIQPSQPVMWSSRPDIGLDKPPCQFVWPWPWPRDL